MVPRNFELLYSKEQIAERVRVLGEEISIWADDIWKRSHSDVLAVPILRGGIIFFADLVRKITPSVEVAPAQAWAYDNSERLEMLKEINFRLDDIPAKGRSVLLIDDVCETGRTLSALKDAFMEGGATEVKAAVLVRRKFKEQSFKPDWTAFEYPGREWFVGYGLEDLHRWRNLPELYIIRQGDSQD